ncbi:hypothetical protein G6L37_03990 [Agrobacterium rubi]|nr:hypothetical protein [Agrobacterium rubi]NTF24511.1 hypothetical protein [Agrobacterium rubi]
MRKMIVATALLLLSAAAHAAPMVLDANPKAQARSVVNVVFGDYLAQRVAAKIETGVVDLDKDGVGEIVTRFVHTGSCTADMKLCRTTIIRHDGRTWRVVFDHPTAQLEVLSGPNGVPAPLKADRITWNWKFPTYAPSAEGIGERLSLDPVPASTIASLAPAFGEGASKLAAADPRHALEFARPKLSGKDEFIAVTLKGGSACGKQTGCPVRILRKEKDGWRPVLSTSATSSIFVGNAQRDGYRDLVVDTKNGFAVYGWGGNGYALADRVEAPEGGRK